MQDPVELFPPLPGVKEKHAKVSGAVDKDESEGNDCSHELELFVRPYPDSKSQAHAKRDHGLQNNRVDGSLVTKMDFGKRPRQ